MSDSSQAFVKVMDEFQFQSNTLAMCAIFMKMIRYQLSPFELKSILFKNDVRKWLEAKKITFFCPHEYLLLLFGLQHLR